jgi:glutathione S-transferase
MKGHIRLPGLPPIPRPENLADLSALAPSVLRFGRGLIARGPATRLPVQPLELHEFEGCPFCRKVRDVLTELDIGYISRAAGKGGNRSRLVAAGGKAQVPYLADPNTGDALYESEDIIDHLHRHYGAGPRPAWKRVLAPLDTAGSALASASRPRGNRVDPLRADGVQPTKLLELWSFEASPYCRKVREELSRLGLDYMVHNVGKRGRRRPELVALGGKMQVPYLVDPNHGVAMYESDDIIAYLRQTYAR